MKTLSLIIIAASLLLVGCVELENRFDPETQTPASFGRTAAAPPLEYAPATPTPLPAAQDNRLYYTQTDFLKENMEQYIEVNDENGQIVTEIPYDFSSTSPEILRILDNQQAKLIKEKYKLPETTQLEVKQREKFKKGELIVKLKSNAIGFPAGKRYAEASELSIQDAELKQVFDEIQVKKVKKMYSFMKTMPEKLDNIFVVYFDESKSVLESLVKIKKIANVEYSEVNAITRLPNTDVKPVQVPSELLENQDFPNDPLFNQQWALHNTGQNGGFEDIDIDAPEAWKIEKGSEKIIIAIVDTGVNS